MQGVIGRDVEGRDCGSAIRPASFQGKAMQAVIMHDIERAIGDPFAGGCIGGIKMVDEHRRSAMLGPRKDLLIMHVDDWIDSEDRIAIARSKEGDIMPPPAEASRQLPCMGFHPAGKRLADALAHMRQKSDPHAAAVATVGVWAACFCLASNRRRMVAVFA